MELTFVRPHAVLRPFVKAIWAFESPHGLGAAEQTVMAPTGNAKLILSGDNPIISRINGRDRALPDRQLYLLGVRDHPVQLSTAPAATSFVVVDFEPQGAFPILGTPMNALTNRIVPLTEVFSTWKEEMSAVLGSSDKIAKKVALVHEFLCRRAAASAGADPVTDSCVRMLTQSEGTVSMPDLERRTGYTARRLEMLFQERVGIPPKRLADILRFQALYRRWAANKSYETLVDDGYHRYYDQAHFAKAFKRMTGYPPLYYTKNIGNELGHRLTRV